MPSMPACTRTCHSISSATWRRWPASSVCRMSWKSIRTCRPTRSRNSLTTPKRIREKSISALRASGPRCTTPSGKYLMEDFFYAGGLRALMAQMRDLLDLSCITVSGRTLGEAIATSKVHLPDVIHSLDNPLYPEGATAVLTGNLAPRGCVMKPAAAEKRLLRHRGKAIAFENYDHMAREIDRDDLEATPDHVLVLKNGGPRGGPGMPEWGQLPIPKKLLKTGVRDMLRISDARMSGTSYGACILHVAPESFVGGPLALVQNGDEIEVDVDARRIHLHVAAEELTRRHAAWKPPPPHYLAATAPCSPPISVRPTKAAISIFLKASRLFPNPRFIDP